MLREAIRHWKIVRGDVVKLIAGHDRGLTGVVLRVLRKDNKVLVQNLNKKTHFQKGEAGKGRVVEREAPIHISNVKLIEPPPGTVPGAAPAAGTGTPVRVGWRFLEDGTRVRVSRGRGASGTVIEKPAAAKERTWPRPVRGARPPPAPATQLAHARARGAGRTQTARATRARRRC